MAHSFIELALLIPQQPLLVPTPSKLQPTHKPRSRQVPSYNTKQHSVNSLPQPPLPTHTHTHTQDLKFPDAKSHLSRFNRPCTFSQLRIHSHVQTFQNRDKTGKW